MTPVGALGRLTGAATADARTVDLNALLPANSGLSGTTSWSILNGAGGAATVSGAGVLSLPAGAAQQELTLVAKDSLNKTFALGYTVGLVSSSFENQLYALAGQSGASMVDLNRSLGTLSGGRRTWGFKAGQQIPSWLTLDAMSGTLAAAPPAGTPAGAQNYLVEVYDADSSEFPVTKKTGSVSVGVTAFRTSVAWTREATLNVDLTSKLTANSGLGTGVTWSLGTPASGAGVSVSSSGMFTAVNTTSLQQDFLVKAVDSTGKAVLGSVFVNAPSINNSVILPAVVASAGGSLADLNIVPGISIGYPALNRQWAPSAGTILPSWMTLSASGVVTFSPAAADPDTVVFVDQTWIDTANSFQKVTIALRCVVSGFNIPVSSVPMAMGNW